MGIKSMSSYHCDICGNWGTGSELPTGWETIQLYSIKKFWIFSFKTKHGKPHAVCKSCNGNGIYNFNQCVRNLAIKLWERL